MDAMTALHTRVSSPRLVAALDKSDVDSLVSQERDFAVYYSNRLVDYLCNNSTLFPEYSSNTNSDVNPATDNNFCGWGAVRKSYTPKKSNIVKL